MRNLITVVMPAYNAESTIKRAIQSVIDQTYQDWELIIVDDASTDSSVNIIKEYTDKDSRIRLITKDTNGGAGLARRTGIENRDKSSQYLCFLDSDDYFNNDYLETLYNAAREYNVDVVSGGMNVTECQNPNDNRTEIPPELIILDEGNNYYSDPDEKAIYPRFMNLCLMRSTLWNRVQYSGRRFLEDTPTFVKILYFANNRAMIPYAGYNYVQKTDSICHNVDDKKRLLYTILSSVESASFYKNLKKDTFISFVTSVFLSITNFKKEYTITDEDRVTYSDELSEIAQFLINNLNFGK